MSQNKNFLDEDGLNTLITQTQARFAMLRKGLPGGVAELNSSGKIPITQESADDTLSTSSTNPIQNGVVTTEFNNVKQALSNEAEARAELGAKNLWPITLADLKKLNTDGVWNANAFTRNNMTFTANVNGGYVDSISISGTNNSASAVPFNLPIINLNKDLILSGAPVGGGVSSVAISLNNGVLIETGAGIMIPSSTTLSSAIIRVAGNYAFPSGGLTVNPMMRLASDSDSTYQPYSKTNQELTKANEALLYNDSLVLSEFPKMINPIEITEKTFANLQMLSGTIVEVSSVRKSVICRIVPNTYINIKKLQSIYCGIGFTTEYPANGVTLNSAATYTGVENTDIGAQAGSNDNYMICTYYTSGSDPTSASDMEAAMHVYYSCSEYSQFDMLAHADSHLINLLKYRPIGKLSKPYIAISCDDGNAVLATYTIPKIREWAQTYGKNIPVTFGLMEEAAVMLNDTYKAAVIDSVTNYGSAIAIHGVHSYFNYSRKQLMKYIKKQDAYLYSQLGVKPCAVIYPEHQYNDFIQTFCGSFYNVCGCGGSVHHLAYTDESDRPFYDGEKSNCYEVYRLAIHDTRITSLNDVEDIIDYAYDHNYIICPYFHDVDLGDSAPNKDYLRGILDKFVSYGVSKGIDFVKLGDIPHLL